MKDDRILKQSFSMQQLKHYMQHQINTKNVNYKIQWKITFSICMAILNNDIAGMGLL